MNKQVHYYFNYSGSPVEVTYSHSAGTELFTGKRTTPKSVLKLSPWDVAIVEED